MLRTVSASFAWVAIALVWLLAAGLVAANADLANKLFENIEQEVNAFAKNPKARMYRERYEDLAFRLSNLASLHPEAPQAPKALLVAAELLDDLARTTKRGADCNAAIRAYGQVQRAHGQSQAAVQARMQMALAKMRCGQAPAGEGKAKARHDNAAKARHDKTKAAKELDSLIARISEDASAGAPLAPPPRKAAAPPGKRRVVIDPGHGGMDSGAVGKHGGREKDATLAIGLKVREFLKKEMPGAEVFMTRDGDSTVSLRERTDLANRVNADLFVSIHINSNSNTEVSGIETYYLDLTHDHYAVRLAMRENAMSETEMSNLAFILADLATKANTEDSKHLGDSIQDAVIKNLRTDFSDVRDLGVKNALLYVLLGVRMPAVLIETSFLSNPKEEKRLKSGKYIDATARGVAKGIRDYFDEKKDLYATR